MSLQTCPHCRTTIRQSRDDGRCVACGEMLPEELRSSTLLPGHVLYNGVAMHPAHVARTQVAQRMMVYMVRGQLYHRCVMATKMTLALFRHHVAVARS